VYRKFVEAGRVTTVNFGADASQVAIIVDIVDKNRVLVVFPFNNYKRVTYPLKRLSISTQRLNILRGTRNSLLKKVIAESKFEEKWKATSIAKKQEQREKRSSLKDLDRFKVMINRKNRSYKLRQLVKKVQKK